ncbi:DUF6155 family protein [Clostridium tagluense]|nr:DUF6155 family protein [Clostridium tagluense]MCB2312072.1 DUF6155 family protein [Clostridium tagluense]MCB2316743.1 DUF6155 family protein [Clostridium tagluense]MCB2321516.1 DUF6155 family protein [Clostridium tagluense]MCB2326612.1 DUF6155 family protein [Clostridium tagluense]MCB2331335.1 DUF6155 family protein [Clostridium tagluense]
MKNGEELLSVTEVKNILKEKSREELLELLIESYKTIPLLKEHISVKYGSQDNIEKILEAYKNKIYNVFFPKNMKTQFKIGDAKKVVNEFKRICSNEKLTIELRLYYVEMGIEFTNTYGDINEAFYNSVVAMYEAVVSTINKQHDSEIYNNFKGRLKAVVEDTNGMGWGFHDELSNIYWQIKEFNLDEIDIDIDEEEVKNIKKYIFGRLEKRKDLASFGKNIALGEVVSEIVDADEVFIIRMDARCMDYSNDEEVDFISKRTGYSEKLIEIILWQKCCYEMENDYWEYEGKCIKCGNSKLYIKEVHNVDFSDQVICKECETEFIR